MNMSKNTFAVALGLLLSFDHAYATTVDEPPPDETIHILVFKEPNVDQSFVDSKMQILMSAWDNSEFIHDDAPVSLTIINPGAAFSTVINLSNSSPLTAIDGIKLLVSTSLLGNPSIRDALAADVIMLFVDEFGLPCGKAPQDNWLGPTATYEEGPDGLDLRGRGINVTDGFYVAAVASEGLCAMSKYSDTAAHEFGHLFGAGHDSAGAQTGLLPNSRPTYDLLFIPFAGTLTRRTIMADPFEQTCVDAWRGFCMLVQIYSDHFFFEPGRINTDAMDVTAVSVAQYRVGQPALGFVEQCVDGIDNDGDGDVDGSDSECATGIAEIAPPPPPPPVCNGNEAPFGVYVYLVQTCVVTPTHTWTQYRLHWSHACDSNVDYYNIWGDLPSNHILGTSLSPPQDVYIDGGSGRVRVQACNSSGCSPQIPSFGILIHDIC